MKVLLLIDNLSTGGSQRQMVNLALGLQRRGHNVRVFCYTPGDLLAAALNSVGISIVWFRKRARFSPDVLAALRREIKQNNCDVVLSYLQTPNVYAILSTRGMTGRPAVVVSERSFDPAGGPSLLQRLIRLLYRFADGVVVNSHHQRENIAARHPGLRHKLMTIYNGYDLEIFSPPEQEPDNDPLRFLVVARVSRIKNGQCLIRALEILRAEWGFTPTVDWIGQISRGGDHQVYYQDMQVEIKRLKQQAQWSFLGQRTDVVEQLHSHDALVHPSYGEGLPNVVCEAMACGRPVVVSDTLDHPLLVRDGESGLLFNYRDPHDLASALRRLHLLGPAGRSSLGQRARRYAEENLSLERLAAEYEVLFLSLAK